MVTEARISHERINFKTVKEILDASKDGRDIKPFLSEKFPDLERQVAILAFQEVQLIKVSNLIKLENEVSKKKITQKIATKLLHKVYCELNIDSKYELLPLFYSTDMVTENSIYLEGKEIRDIFFKSFQSLINKDKLKVDNLKRDYLEYQDLAYLLPLHEYVKAGQLPVPARTVEKSTKTDRTFLQVMVVLGGFLANFYFFGLLNGILIWGAICFIWYVIEEARK